MTYTSDKALWLDQDGKVTDEPPSSGTLLVGEGGELSDEDAAKYGLTGEAKADEKAQSAPPENKAKQAPPETK